jgi:hypothetical protein
MASWQDRDFFRPLYVLLTYGPTVLLGPRLSFGKNPTINLPVHKLYSATWHPTPVFGSDALTCQLDLWKIIVNMVQHGYNALVEGFNGLLQTWPTLHIFKTPSQTIEKPYTWTPSAWNNECRNVQATIHYKLTTLIRSRISVRKPVMGQSLLTEMEDILSTPPLTEQCASEESEGNDESIMDSGVNPKANTTGVSGVEDPAINGITDGVSSPATGKRKRDSLENENSKKLSKPNGSKKNPKNPKSGQSKKPTKKRKKKVIKLKTIKLIAPSSTLLTSILASATNLYAQPVLRPSPLSVINSRNFRLVYPHTLEGNPSEIIWKESHIDITQLQNMEADHEQLNEVYHRSLPGNEAQSKSNHVMTISRKAWDELEELDRRKLFASGSIHVIGPTHQKMFPKLDTWDDFRHTR